MAKIIPLSAAADAAAYFLRSKRIDPSTAAKRARNAVKLNIDLGEKFSNSAALTPPMGWSSWNLFRNKINENLIYDTAKAMKDSGLADCGYVYVNLDDCWQSSLRDDEGRLQGDFANFPSGIKALVEKVNALGLKLGIYSSNGTLTCEDLPASLGNEAKDAETFARWGIEYFKYDFCHNVPIPSRAPCIEAIAISRPGSENENVYGSELAFLSGGAKIVEDSQLSSGRYIDGLSGNAGAAEFVDVEAEEDGEYILTLCLRKKSNSNKYADILVNGTDIYSVTVPATRAPSSEGRHQIKINLKKGKNTIKIYNPVGSRFDSAAKQYIKMGRELKKATAKVAAETGCPEKPIVYSICEWGLNLPWTWASHAGNLWRTTPDIKPFWASVLGIYEINVNLYKHAGPGTWNDPDMLEVGNGSLSYEENKSHSTLWCMMAAPLILGNDIRSFLRPDGTPNTENPAYRIVTNRDVIAIDQDRLGEQCRRIKTNGLCDVLLKPLENNEVAVCFFNKSSSPVSMSHSLKDIACRTFVKLPITDEYEATELWDKTTEVYRSSLTASVPAHGVKVFRIKAK